MSESSPAETAFGEEELSEQIAPVFEASISPPAPQRTVTRAGGSPATAVTQVPATEDSKKQMEPALPQGARVHLALVSPVSSAYALAVTARTVADVTDGAGRILIPAGTIIHLPLDAPDPDGRFHMGEGLTAWYAVGDGKERSIAGSVRGIDGTPGIPGKADKPGRFGRLVRGLAEAGAGAASEFGPTRDVAAEIDEELRSRRAGRPGTAVVKIKAGTRFQLVVR